MGTITQRVRSDGKTSYTAQIRLRRGGIIIHAQTQTFEREAAAKAWLKKRETELAQPGALEKPKDPTLAEVIEKYSAENLKAHGKTKTQVLRTISESSLAKLRCSEIKSQHLVSFAKSIKAQPQTVLNYMSHLGSVFSVARPAWGYPLDKGAIDDARVVLARLGLTQRSRQRTRRPSLDELKRLLNYFGLQEARRPNVLPMRAIMLFALFSTRRQEEITRMVWADLHIPSAEITIRNMKNPGEKLGNDVATQLTSEALALITQRPQTKDRIWPYSAESIGTAFRRACQFLAIKDLHFHDLRHEGISRLFEMGWSIPKVACVSGHRTWQGLQRYTHVRQDGDKYAAQDWVGMTKKTPTKKNPSA